MTDINPKIDQIKANEATKLLGRILREAREQKKKLLKEGKILYNQQGSSY
jgi:hypothetical protein